MNLCYIWQTFEDFNHEKEATGFLNNCISHRQRLTIQTDLSENWLKSANRSHIRRPLRAAFAEYTGPIPFFVVPRLVGQQQTTEEQDGGKKTEGKSAHDLHRIFFLQIIKNRNHWISIITLFLFYCPFSHYKHIESGDNVSKAICSVTIPFFIQYSTENTPK